MTYPIGRGVTVEVQATTSAPKTVTAVTLANPGVVTSAAHGLSDGSAGYFTSIVGMVQLDGQVARVDNGDTNTFEIEGLDTTNYSTFTSGSFVPIATWATLGNASGYSIGGGEADKIDQTTLLDIIRQEVTGLLPSQSVTINGFSEFQSAGMLICQNAAMNTTALVFRVTLADGQERLFRGVPSLPGEDGQVGQSMTGSFSISVIRRVMFLA